MKPRHDLAAQIATLGADSLLPEWRQRMDITDFGDALIRTGDLDPVYVAIHGAQLPRDQLCRLLLSYWCFYHLGAAARLSEETDYKYWALMLEAAKNQTPLLMNGLPIRWPRVAERRHFRGPKCVSAVGWMRDHSPRPENYVERLFKYTEAKYVMNQVQTWPMFGPWIAFKAADMLERCAGVPVRFDHDLGLIYEEPRKGLDLLMTMQQEHVTNDGALFHYQGLLRHFEFQLAPPGLDRPCGPQEVETVLCKFKSYMHGHYQIGKDIREVRHALAGWGETASRLLAACPEKVT